MTVPVQFPYISHTASGVSAVFSFDFLVIKKDDLLITINDLQVAQGDFSVTGLGEDNGGTVTILTGAPLAGASVVIQRDIALSRDFDYQQSGEFRSVTVNSDFDRIWMALQDTQLDRTSALRYPTTENLDGTLPSAPSRVNMLLGFDALGKAVMTPPSATIGAGDMRVDTFTAGVDFTGGVSTQLTLSRAPGNPANLEVFFDALYQGPDQWSVSGTTVTFTSPIPVGVSKVFARTGTTLSTSIPPDGSVTDAKVAAPSRLYNRIHNIIDVKDYGAVGDGLADDTAAFVSAIADAASRGGSFVHVPAGEYLITSTLTLLNGVSLIGECGAPTFGELSLIAVSEIRWGGIVGGTMLTTVTRWSGRIEGILLEGNYSAGILFHPISPTGSLFQNFNGQHSTQIGWLWDTDGVTPSGLNTSINCAWHDHQNIAVELTGQPNSPVTLNTFLGCRYNGAAVSLRILQYADTNQWYGGRIEGGSSFGLIINDGSGGLNTDSIAFYGTTFDGTNVPGSTMCYIGKSLPVPPPGGSNTVAAFRDCHFTQSTYFNGAPAGANIKVMDCPFFGNMFGGNGDHGIPQDVTVGASPFTYTNNDPYAEMVNIQGGSVSGISFIRAGNVRPMSMTSGLFYLNPGDALQVTYSVSPSVFFRYQV